MIGGGLFILTILSNCVLSLPLTPSQLENEDVKVMKCIVEALADVLSRPQPMPVSQQCLVTLKTDDRLVSILRHHNFLKELQEIAVQGGHERAQLQGDAGTPDPTTHTPQTAGDVADRSMLEALGGPGERSILSQKSRTGNGDGEEEKDESLEDGESQEDNDIDEEVQMKRENDERPGSPSVDEWSEDKAEKREEEEEEDEYGEKRANLEENSEEENMTKDKKGAGSGEKRDASRNKSKEKKFDGEDEEEKDNRSALFSHKQEEAQEEEEDEGEMKRGSRESLKRWTKRGKALALKKKVVGTEAQQLNSRQEVQHHSKEATEEEEVKKKRDPQRSPEEKELQMIARRGPEERRGLEEEGSASRKSEEPEIESLAAIESELENVAQKLHELRRG